MIKVFIKNRPIHVEKTLRDKSVQLFEAGILFSIYLNKKKIISPNRRPKVLQHFQELPWALENSLFTKKMGSGYERNVYAL